MAYCSWNVSPENMRYHDEVWGVPQHGDQHHFEHISYEVMQCGLSWWLIYGRRHVLRECFENFDIQRVSEYGNADVARILAVPGMIRSERKIRAIINNARRFLEIQREFSSFDNYIWKYSDYKTILYDKHADGIIPASNGLSETISRDLKKRGLKYMGPIVVYSHMQAVGMINDHDKSCPRYQYIVDNYPCIARAREQEKGVVDYSPRP